MSFLAALLVLFLPMLVAGVPAAGAETEQAETAPSQTVTVSEAEPQQPVTAAPDAAAAVPAPEAPAAPAEVSDPRAWDHHSSYDVPPGAAGRRSPPRDQEGGSPSSPPAEQPAEPPSQPQAGAGAMNESLVYQAIYQRQIGCRSHCTGSRMSQLAAQGSSTTQTATAVSSAGSVGGAAAVNVSSTAQFIWQVQLGCVAFCWDTEMHQGASQDSQTTQTATAVGSGGTAAQNVAEGSQNVWQYQEGCQTECYGASSSQTLAQQQSTNQSASASGSGTTPPAGWDPNGPASFFAWVSMLATNAGATFQIVHQDHEAGCLENCGPSALEQRAEQQAVTSQSATACDLPEPVASTPPVETPPAEASAAEPAAAGPVSAGEPPHKRKRHGASFAPERVIKERVLPQASEAPAKDRPAGSDGPTLSTGSGSDAIAQQLSSSTTGASADEGVASATPDAQPTAPPSLGLDTAIESGNGIDTPWLPYALIAVAGLASVAALRTPRDIRA